MEHGFPLPGYLPSVAESLPLPVGIKKVTVRGNEKLGKRPYIEMDHAKYTNDVLRECWHLIGTPFLGLLQHDHRMLKVRTFDGADPVGTLNVTGHWSHSFHEQAVRTEIIRQGRQRAREYEGQSDPMQIWAAQKRGEMAKHAAADPVKVLRGSNKTIGTLLATAAATRVSPPAPRKLPSGTGRWTSTRVGAEGDEHES
jgi:hypothetical protein